MKLNLFNFNRVVFSILLFLSILSTSSQTIYAQLGGSCGAEEIDSAIGCIPISDTVSFSSWVFGWSIGVGGGIAFLLIIYASFLVMTSQGMPDRLKAGQELLTSAITGLVMLIFSVFILNFIGFDILGLDLL